MKSITDNKYLTKVHGKLVLVDGQQVDAAMARKLVLEAAYGVSGFCRINGESANASSEDIAAAIEDEDVFTTEISLAFQQTSLSRKDSDGNLTNIIFTGLCFAHDEAGNLAAYEKPVKLNQSFWSKVRRFF